MRFKVQNTSLAFQKQINTPIVGNKNHMFTYIHEKLNPLQLETLSITAKIPRYLSPNTKYEFIIAYAKTQKYGA